MPIKVNLPDGRIVNFPDGMNEQQIAAEVAKLSPVQVKAARPDDFTEKPPPQTLGRFVGGAVSAALPSTTPSDYITGPIYAATHPIDSAKLIGNAIYQGSADQGAKAKEAAGRVFTSPTFGGKVGAASEAVGHAAGMIPIVGTPAANVGEQLGSGDIAGGVGAATGLLGSQFAGEAVKAAAKPVSRAFGSGNVTRMEQALGATTNENKTRAARVAPEMVKRRIWARDLPTLETRAEVASSKAGADVQAEVAKVANKQTDVLPLVDSLEKVKASAMDTNNAGQRVIIEPDQVKAIQNLQDTLMEYGDRMSVGSLNKVRLKWDEVVKAGKGFTLADPTWKTWAAREGRSVLRDELSSANPDVDTAMAEYSFWQNIEDVSEATNKRRVGQGAGGGLIPSIAGGAAAIAGEALVPGSSVAMKVGGAAIAGKLGASLKRLTSSPGWKMFTAVQRQRIADALANGNVELIDDAWRAANSTNRLVGPSSQPQHGRISIVGTDAGTPDSRDEQAKR